MRSTLGSAGYAVVNWTRRLRKRPSARITDIVVLAGRGDVPDHLHPRRLYELGQPGKWAILTCPCGRGHTIELNLAHPGRARWTLTANDEQDPSLRPSVDVRAERRCHFWLRDGRVHWA